MTAVQKQFSKSARSLHVAFELGCNSDVSGGQN